MEPTVAPAKKSVRWRVGHAVCELLGAGFFLLGSVVNSPLVFKPFDETQICSKIYIFGCFFYILSHALEFLHFAAPSCKQPRVALNHLLIVLGFATFMMGSTYHPSEADALSPGEMLYAAGSSLLAVAYSLKLLRLLNAGPNWWWENLKDNASEFLADFCCCMAALMYLAGTYLYIKLVFDLRSLALVTSTCFVVGAACLLLAGLFLVKRYFFDPPPPADYRANALQLSNAELRDII